MASAVTFFAVLMDAAARSDNDLVTYSPLISAYIFCVGVSRRSDCDICAKLLEMWVLMRRNVESCSDGIVGNGLSAIVN